MKILIGRQATGFGRKASTPSQVLRLANGEIDLDGIDSGDGGNRATAGLNERADLQECLAGDALDGCGEAREFEIDSGGFDGGFVRADLCFRGFYGGDGSEIVLDGVIEVLLAGSLLAGKRRIPVDI